MLLDVRALLVKLEAGNDDSAVWDELWNELHHQGDVGEASYAAVPHLVRIYRKRGIIDWNTYAIVAIIELAREKNNNPEIPKWLEVEYFQALHQLAECGAAEILNASDDESIRSILAILAIVKNLRIYGEFLAYYPEQELLEMLK